MIVTLAGILASPSGADTLSCGKDMISVVSDDANVAGLVCQHAESALDHFSRCGFSLTEPVRIETTNALQASCLGLFHCGEAWIEVLSPKALEIARADQTLFAHIPTDRLFESVILHELAHALYDKTPCPLEHCVASSEYFAYTHQISALSDIDREPFDEAIDNGRAASRDSINAIMLMMAPDRFALNAWSHYSALDDQCTYLQGILDGVILFDHMHP